MIKLTCVAIAFVAFALARPGHGEAPTGAGRDSAHNPLDPFERLIGGQWHLEGSYQEFEWGVGGRSVKARGYFTIDGSPRLASEGIWFWHPGEGRIKGVFTMIDMPVVLIDYTTRFEGSTMENELRSYGVDGRETSYIETWDFTDDDHYLWKLMRNTKEGLQEEMSGMFTRK